MPSPPQTACTFKELEFPHWRQTSYSMGEDYFSEVSFQEGEVGLTVVWQLWPQSLLLLFISLKLFSSNCEQPLRVGNCPKRPETQVCPPRRWKVGGGGGELGQRGGQKIASGIVVREGEGTWWAKNSWWPDAGSATGWGMPGIYAALRKAFRDSPARHQCPNITCSLAVKRRKKIL